jgi:lipid-A-disaccharide synthase-like uncharacterized protein
MNTSSFWIYAVGLAGQLFFAARMIVQWVQSEKAYKPLSPVIFWQLSIIGSLIFLAYGILRCDLAIVLGQVLVYFIYLRNLHLKDYWLPLNLIFKIFVIVVPIGALIYLIADKSLNIRLLLKNEDISLPLQIWGIAGQLTFTLRFYIQWIDSELKKESVLTPRFWLVSLLGSVMIITYAILRYDPILLIGQLAGMLVYLRNLMLGRTQKEK